MFGIAEVRNIFQEVVRLSTPQTQLAELADSFLPRPWLTPPRQAPDSSGSEGQPEAEGTGP